jgi:chromosome segregation ATPase
MEIARLAAIYRKTKCGPLENEIVCLRAQIATLEEHNADLEEGRYNYESQYALMEKQLARKDAKLEAEEKERADLEAALEKENADLEAEIYESSLKLEHKQGHKKVYDLYKEELQENMGQYGQILELEEENENPKDQMAVVAM